jgi:hypothetical protein
VLQAGQIGEAQQLYAVRSVRRVNARRLQSALSGLSDIEAARLLDHNDDIRPDLALAELVDKVGLLLESCVSPLLIIKYWNSVSFNTQNSKEKVQLFQ